MNRRAFLLGLPCTLLLAGCQFQPLYARKGGGGTINQHLAAVRILPLTDRPGQMLHNALRNELNALGQKRSPVYELAVSLRETREEIALRRDETATRVNLRMVASYRLRRSDNGEELDRGSTFSISSFNIVESEFATFSAESDARERSIDQLAEAIRLQLAGYFDRAIRG